MRGTALITLGAAAAVLAAVIASELASGPAAGLAVPDARPGVARQHVVTAAAPLRQGQALTSPDGRYAAGLDGAGRIVVTRGSTVVWHTRPAGKAITGAVLRVRPSGNVTLVANGRRLWATDTDGSQAGQLALRNDGVLALRSAGGLVWTSNQGNLCRAGTGTGDRVDVDLTTQFAKLCSGDRQLLTTPITSGATAVGDGTPTGTWAVQSKQRDTYLYPAAGGVYYVRYWLPYDGAYGMHDSSWQPFPYGSGRYRTQGSHGCVHFPLAAISWMYGWIRVGTTVQIHY